MFVYHSTTHLHSCHITRYEPPFNLSDFLHELGDSWLILCTTLDCELSLPPVELYFIRLLNTPRPLRLYLIGRLFQLTTFSPWNHQCSNCSVRGVAPLGGDLQGVFVVVLGVEDGAGVRLSGTETISICPSREGGTTLNWSSNGVRIYLQRKHAKVPFG